ncbi:hypothetical protein M422DRAFT_32883 [Sphaerobolus stellatus SS14]|uniref:Guanine nucleotide-binding protein subunit alpha n=1 Tax=Sphaerobolus stellatus (strain SS14) TaxID=990650 RepID=A0A0C9UVX0_SPHS4|nr:hypothetical protein M422DRAFT_32883 [Sphaerobolus stellatus SS14]
MPVRTDGSNEDPLTRALLEEIGEETEAEQQLRLKKEKEARRVSESIDELLKQDKAALKKTRPVKILLLGKSTALKNFQIMHTPQAWEAERPSWRGVIQLNLIRSVRMILEAMTDAAIHSSSRNSRIWADRSQSPDQEPLSAKSSDLLSRCHYLEERLRPLLEVEETLIQRLAIDTESGDPTTTGLGPQPKFREISVNAHSWKSSLHKLVQGTSKDGTLPSTNEEEDGISQVIASCKEDIHALWTDPNIDAILKKRKLRVDDLPGFFLNDLDRIANVNYVPSDDDVLRARLKTVGVTEYRFTRETPNTMGADWRIYDVGGSRTQRAAWAPYFQDVDAIIFLAPISCFDQALVEDPNVNRLEDTVLLWKQVCRNPLLAKCHIVLFMNKTDLMDKKLRSGVRLNRYIPSYANRENDFATASAYLQRKFQVIFHEHSPQRRTFYCHLTALTDMQASGKLLASVADMVFQAYLRDNDLI